MRLLIAGDTRQAESLAGELNGRGYAARAFVGDPANPEVAAWVVTAADALIYFPPQATTTVPLADILHETYTVLLAALEAGVKRFIIGSSLRLFARVPENYRVSELWRPYPSVEMADLIPLLTELGAHELVRTAPDSRTVLLRFGEGMSLSETGDAIADALHQLEDERWPPFWRIVHRGTSSRAPADNRPWREVLFPVTPIPARPIRNVVLFGAGGPVARAIADDLSRDYTLRLTDIRPLDEIAAENKPQSYGAPVACPFPAPHENRVVDICDPTQVKAACEGMDAIINCSVVREDKPEAFRVNAGGAFHIAQAAVKFGIQRVVQTGPQLATLCPTTGYRGEYEIPGNAPARPGRWVYSHSKYLGQEILRVYAEQCGLSVPCLLFDGFVNPETARPPVYFFAVTWADTGRAVRAALEVPSLPTPYEVMNICADLPYGVISPRRATELLGWEATDPLQDLWS